MSNFEQAKNKIILEAERKAMTYLSTKYGISKLARESLVELTYQDGSIPHTFDFTGKITCFADSGALLNPVVGVDMTVNSNDIEVESENIPAIINNALNTAEEHSETVVASLGEFKLTANSDGYLAVSHPAFYDAELGKVSENEFKRSKDKSTLLQAIVTDSMSRVSSQKYAISFTGEFKEPTIGKAAQLKDCWECGAEYDDKNKYQDDLCNKCRGAKSDKKASLTEVTPQPKKSSWLTADLDVAAEAPYFQDLSEEAQQKILEYVAGHLGGNFPQEELSEEIDNFINIHNDGASIGKMLNNDFSFTKEASPIAIKEDMPMARAHDSMSHMAQFEEQSDLEAQLKVEHEASNQLMSLLQGMGYGTAKTVEITSSKDGFDIMTAIDDGGAVKAVSIPVTVKEGKVILPKKALISTLIARGLDVKAKLVEQFDLETLEKLAAIDEKMAYEAKEAEDILNEKVASVEKAAAGEKQPFFDSDDSTMTVNKFMLPNHEDLKEGDELNDGVDKWKIVNQSGTQNDKNEGSSSQWTLKKIQAPQDDGKESKNKIPS